MLLKITNNNMENSEKFINWLEGFLDASKNKINSTQVKEIRKKIKLYHEQAKNELIPIYDNGHWTGVNFEKYAKNTEPEINEEYLKEIEKNKAASTMEQLVD
jgi:hypothetical protein